MNTQLILYPQNYDGMFNSTANVVSPNYIANGAFFTGLSSAPLNSNNAVIPYFYAINTQGSAIPNAWYRYTTIAGGSSGWGAVTAPTNTSGNLVLSHNSTTAGKTGVYQRILGLSVGGVYNVIIDFQTVGAGVLGNPPIEIAMFNGSTYVSGAYYTLTSGVLTHQFTAQSVNNDVFLIDYFSGSEDCIINSISIKEVTTTPTTVYTDLFDGQVICDLYQEEDIPLTLSIDDFKNVAEKVQSYSKDFNLPATKRNNRIFNNMFEITRTDDGLIFNPYIKTKCVLKQDGFILFEGYLRLIDVKEEKAEVSYNVNLYSEVVALADILKNKTLQDLDLSELSHEYNKTSIKNSWETGAGNGLPLSTPLTDPNEFAGAVGATVTQVLKYPFIDWTGQTLIGGNFNTSATIGNVELTSLEQAFRPCIKLKYLIDKIFADAGFNYTSAFFDTTDFGNLFMDFNWGSDISANTSYDGGGQAFTSSNVVAGTSFATVEQDNNTFSSNVGYSSGVYTSPQNARTYAIDYLFFYQITGSGTFTAEFRWKHYNAATGVTSYIDLTSFTGNTTLASHYGQINMTLNQNDTLTPEIKRTGSRVFTVVPALAGSIGTVVSVGNADVNAESLLNLRGELGQWDFLKGIFTMFNLVSLTGEDNQNNILIEPYADVFVNSTSGTTLASRSVQHDWTDKIDVSKMELKPLSDLNKETIFKFVEEDDDFTFQNYKKYTSGYLYGSQTFDASSFTILEGTEEITADPFAATIQRPIKPQFPEFIVPIIFAKTEEGSTEGFDNAPRIFFDNGKVDMTGISTYFIPDQNGLTAENQPKFLQFSHLSEIPTTVTTNDFVFSSHQLYQPIGASPTNNLYSLYWQPYFNELYNPDTRIMTLKVNLSPSDVAAFKFNDTVFIKNRVFRVNNINYKPNDLATVEFILIP